MADLVNYDDLGVGGTITSIDTPTTTSGSGETLGQAWSNFFSENPVTSFLQEFGFIDPNATQGYTMGQALNQAVTDAEQGGGLFPSSTTVIIVLVLVLLIVIGIAYLTREVVG